MRARGVDVNVVVSVVVGVGVGRVGASRGGSDSTTLALSGKAGRHRLSSGRAGRMPSAAPRWS